jgi:hypothetical protein
MLNYSTVYKQYSTSITVGYLSLSLSLKKQTVVPSVAILSVAASRRLPPGVGHVQHGRRGSTAKVGKGYNLRKLHREQCTDRVAARKVLSFLDLSPVTLGPRR